MGARKRTKLVHEGKYVAEVDVDLIETHEGRSPFFSAVRPENQGRRSRRTESWDSNKITTPGSQGALLTAIQERLYCVKRLDFYLDTLNLDEPGL